MARPRIRRDTEFDLDYFKSLTGRYMSPYATENELGKFIGKLPTQLTTDQAYELREFSSITKVESVYNFKKFQEYFYYFDKVTQLYTLFRKEGHKVGYNYETREYEEIRDFYSSRTPVILDIRYLRYTDLPSTSNTAGLPENYRWSKVQVKKIDYIQNHLKPSILARYAMFKRPTNGLSNVIIDSFIPKLMYQSNFDVTRMKSESKLPSTSVVISPWFADLFGVKQITTEQMCRILGYTKKDIKNLLVKVRRKDVKMVFIGYGGTNVNTIHWLTELCTMTHTLNLFNNVTVYEKDTLEVSNLFRFPKNPESIYNATRNNGGSSSKLSLLTDYELKTLSRTNPILRKKYITNYDVTSMGIDDNTILYGAPDIASREMFSHHDVKFLAATHTGNSAYMHINPTQDSDITVETYGLIQLSIFFMNQLKLALTLLETLANDELDLLAKDVELLNYTFSQDDSLSTDRKYNFQLDHDGHMITAEEANAVV